MLDATTWNWIRLAKSVLDGIESSNMERNLTELKAHERYGNNRFICQLI